MDLGLNGCTAFVAGASAGLGYAAAERLAMEGCRVAICSRDPGRIEEAARRIDDAAPMTRSKYGPAVPVVCDVTDEASIQRAYDEVGEAFSNRLNIVVANAGGPPSGYVDDLSTEDWNRAIQLNLMSTINLTRHGLPLLRAARRASELKRILMITSISAKQPIPNLYASNVTRAGVQGFAKSLAEELGSEGITVNTILPGYTATERLGELSGAIHARTGQAITEIEAGWAASTALGRLGRPEEFGAAAAFLCSEAASFITGHALVVDGGRSKGLL